MVLELSPAKSNRFSVSKLSSLGMFVIIFVVVAK